MGRTCACLSLRRFTVFCLDYLKPRSRLVTAWHTLRRSSCLPALNKIEFSYLNRNLMVPKLHPLTLAFDGNSPEADECLFVRAR
ncbi:hypothetical protein SAMN05444158_6537 [Bradyrhizobium canariense]|uniref:Uncharacterized protein n=1 Tax=Bradyrhizobium canariense TaxID=255045 RepID=A0A1H2AWH9_9BRAD|nr:hypothetical protein SAMN05444158_6537 [Bradyrhizobium canariense]